MQRGDVGVIVNSVEISPAEQEWIFNKYGLRRAPLAFLQAKLFQ